MGEVLSIETVQALPYRDLEYDQIEGAIRSVCDSHEELRTRLESVEAARRDAQESRFALIIQNEELGAELVAARARLESAEAALRQIQALTTRTGPALDNLADISLIARAVLRGIDERSEG